MVSDEGVSPGARMAGWILTGLIVIALLADAGVQLLAPQMTHAQMQETGFPASLAMPLGIVMLCLLRGRRPVEAALAA